MKRICANCGEPLVAHEVSGYYSDVLYCYIGRAGQPIRKYVEAPIDAYTSKMVEPRSIVKA